MLLPTSTSRWSALTTLVMLASCVTSLDANPSPQSTTPALLAMNLSKSPKVIRVVQESQDATASILSRKLDVVTPKKRQDDQLPIKRRTTVSSSAKKSDVRKKRSLPRRETMKGRENRKNKRAGSKSSHIKNKLALKAKFKREKVEQVEKASRNKVNAAKTTTASGGSKPRASETKKADSKGSATKKADGTAKSKSGSGTTKAGAASAAGAASKATTMAPAATAPLATAPAAATTPAAAAAAASVTTTSADLITSTAAAATTTTGPNSSAGRGASLMSVGSMTGLLAVVLTMLA
ncbi:hypothetical protein MVLG_02836 [Microbotryum lychnidis-dioicae p1A1 Lamole]|uniref:Uncharacterized protein n=1 Tax=Microbotryum lychnidis-dioicae (strain p1A1 Lamole / MvSl-1064) TaxID=683840 RepID=U5H6D3_USTV1|nr:hypothetical protein MVLG_02836 [Microbotryum lychnidis-dioicae p1A1 Lamole]|eukprot:KDE06797.1 hypothetical protein MVLG_02836 [Microbotryum lychnidis-dioicae p1A1 Lamole]